MALNTLENNLSAKKQAKETIYESCTGIEDEKARLFAEVQTRQQSLAALKEKLTGFKQEQERIRLENEECKTRRAALQTSMAGVKSQAEKLNAQLYELRLRRGSFEADMKHRLDRIKNNLPPTTDEEAMLDNFARDKKVPQIDAYFLKKAIETQAAGIRAILDGTRPQKPAWRINLKELSLLYSNTSAYGTQEYSSISNAKLVSDGQMLVRGKLKLFSELSMVRMQTPIGSSLEFTDAAAKEAEKWFASQPSIDSYFTSVGGGGGGGLVNNIMAFVSLKDKDDRVPLKPGGRKPTQQDYMQLARKKLGAIPGVQRVSVQDPSLSGFTAQRGYPIELSLRGPDWDKLSELSALIMKRMNDSGKMVDIDTDYQAGM